MTTTNQQSKDQQPANKKIATQHLSRWICTIVFRFNKLRMFESIRYC